MKRITKDPTVRRGEIIDAARHLFLTKEYDKTTMQDVMKRLKIAKGTIYHYFASKQKLLEAVVTSMVDGHLAEIETKLKKTKGNALKKIQMLIDLSDMESEHSTLLNILHQPINATLHLRLLVETLLKLTPIYEKLIRQGCKEGIFQTKHPRECAEFLLSAVQFLTDTGIYPWSKEDLRRRAKAFPYLIEQQLKASLIPGRKILELGEG